MTEIEEKAEKYFKELSDKKIPFTITNVNNCVKQAYKDGYEQGQKELEKENEELKGYKHVIENLKKEGFDSCMSIREFCRNYSNLLKENEELKAKNASLNEYTDILMEQEKDTCGELEAYRNENIRLKAEIKKLITFAYNDGNDEMYLKLKELVR